MPVRDILLARNPVATVASFVLLMPIVAILLSAVLHETLSPALIWGGVLTLAGVGIITIRKIQKRLPMEADPALWVVRRTIIAPSHPVRPHDKR